MKGNNRTNHPSRIGRRSQMEAFGLAFIVMLITVGLLIFLSLRNKAPVNEPITTYVPTQMASNFVNSIISVNIDECTDVEFTVSKLLEHCANGDDVSAYCHGHDACELVNSTINRLLNITLGRQQYSYRLYTQNLGWSEAGGPAGGEIVLSSRGCTDKKEHVHGETLVVQETYRIVYLGLDICKQ